MKKNYYQSGAQKRQAKRGKIALAARNSQGLSSWLTPPETFKADEQDVSFRETENYNTTKDRSDASKNDDFPVIIVNLEIKKAIIAAGPKQPKGTFPKDPLQSDSSFLINYHHFVTQSGLELPRYWLCYSSSMDRVYCQPFWLFSHENVTLQGLLAHFKTLAVQQA